MVESSNKQEQQLEKILEKSQQPRSKRQRKNFNLKEKLQGNSMSQFIKAEKKKFNGADPSFKQAYQFYTDNQSTNDQNLDNYMREVKMQLDEIPYRVLRNRAMAKAFKVVLDTYGATGNREKTKAVVEAIIADNPSSILSAIKYMAPIIARPLWNFAHNYVQKQKWYQNLKDLIDPAMNAVSEYLGAGQNDIDTQYHSRSPLTTLSINAVTGGDDNDQYDGVCP